MEQFGAEVHPDVLRQLQTMSEEDLVLQLQRCGESFVSSTEANGYEVDEGSTPTSIGSGRQITPSLVYTVAHNLKDDISHIIVNNLEALMSNSATQDKLRELFDALQGDMDQSVRLGGDVVGSVLPQYRQASALLQAKRRMQLCSVYSKCIQHFSSYGEQLGVLLGSVDTKVSPATVYYEDMIGKRSIKSLIGISQQICRLQQVMLGTRLYCLKHGVDPVDWASQPACRAAWRSYSEATNMVYSECSMALKDAQYGHMSVVASEDSEKCKHIVSVRCMVALRLLSQIRLNIDTDPLTSPLGLVVGELCRGGVELLAQAFSWLEHGITEASLSQLTVYTIDHSHASTSSVLLSALRKVLHSVVEMATSAVPAAERSVAPVFGLFPNSTIQSSSYSPNGYLTGAIGVLPIEKARELLQCKSIWQLLKSLSATQSVWTRLVIYLDVFVSVSCMYQSLHAWLANGTSSEQYPSVELTEQKKIAANNQEGSITALALLSTTPLNPEQLIPTNNTVPAPALHAKYPNTPQKSLFVQCLVEAALRHQELVCAPYAVHLPLSFVQKCVCVPDISLIVRMFTCSLQVLLEGNNQSSLHPLMVDPAFIHRMTLVQFQTTSLSMANSGSGVTPQEKTAIHKTLSKSYVRLSFSMHDVVKRVLLPPIAVHYTAKDQSLDQYSVRRNARVDVLIRSIYSQSVFPAIVLGEQPLHPFSGLFDVLERLISKQAVALEAENTPIHLCAAQQLQPSTNTVVIPVYNYGMATNTTTATAPLSALRKQIIHATSSLFSLFSAQIVAKLHDACAQAFPAQPDTHQTAANLQFHLDDRNIMGPPPTTALPTNAHQETMLDHVQHLLRSSLPGPKSLKIHLTKTLEAQVVFITSRIEQGQDKANELAPTLCGERGAADDLLFGAAGVAGKAVCLSMLQQNLTYASMEEREQNVRNHELESLVKTQISVQLLDKLTLLRAAVLTYWMVAPQTVGIDTPAYADPDIRQPLDNAARKLEELITGVVRGIFGDAKNQILRIAHLQQHYPAAAFCENARPPRPIDIARHCFSFLRKRVLPALTSALEPEFTVKNGTVKYSFPLPILTECIDKLITTTLPQIIKLYMVMNASYAQQVSLPCIFGILEWITKNILKPVDQYKGTKEALEFIHIIQEYAQLHRLEKTMVVLYLSQPMTSQQKLKLQGYSCVAPFRSTTKGAMILFLVLTIHTHIQSCVDTQHQLTSQDISHTFKNHRSNEVLLSITNTYLKTSWKNLGLRPRELDEQLQAYQSSKDANYNIRSDTNIEELTRGHTGQLCIQYLCGSIMSGGMLLVEPQQQQQQQQQHQNTTELELMASADTAQDDALNISTTIGSL